MFRGFGGIPFPYVSPPPWWGDQPNPSDLVKPNNPADWIPPVPKIPIRKIRGSTQVNPGPFSVASHVMLPSRKFTYQTWGSWENHLQICRFFGDMLVPWRVTFQKDQRHLPTHRTIWYGSWHLRCYLLLIASVDKEVSTELKLRLPQRHTTSPNPHHPMGKTILRGSGYLVISG